MQPYTVLTSFDETLAAITELCQRYDAKAWLFGSHARGAATKTSDIDIALRCDQFDELEEAIESIETIYLIDVVDLTKPYVKGIEDGWRRIA